MPNRLHGQTVVFACFLLSFAVGISQATPNTLSYVLSYFAFRKKDRFSPNIISWLPALELIAGAFAACFAGFISNKFGVRPVLFVGCLVSVLNQFACYFAVNKPGLLFFTFGVLQGGGRQFVLALASAIAIRWYPSRAGVVSGIVCSGSGLFFAAAVTAWVNPDNLPASHYRGFELFREGALLDRVPSLFFVTGSILCAFQFAGFILTKMPTEAYETLDQGPNQISFRSHARSLLQHRKFQIIFLSYPCRCSLLLFMLSYLKEYGLSIVHDDRFVAGTLASISWRRRPHSLGSIS